jgi:hypothetical protein
MAVAVASAPVALSVSPLRVLYKPLSLRRQTPAAAFQTLLGLGTGRKSTKYEQIRGARDLNPNPLGLLKQPDNQVTPNKLEQVQNNRKDTSSLQRTRTGTPFLMAGLNFQVRTVSTAFSSSPRPAGLMTCASATLPAVVIDDAWDVGSLGTCLLAGSRS